jgi:hypothetical protein
VDDLHKQRGRAEADLRRDADARLDGVGDRVADQLARDQLGRDQRDREEGREQQQPAEDRDQQQRSKEFLARPRCFLQAAVAALAAALSRCGGSGRSPRPRRRCRERS